MTQPDLILAAARFVLGRLDVDDILGVADAVLDTQFTPAAGELLMTHPDEQTAQRLFVQMLGELEVEPPPSAEAVRVVLRDWLQRIVDGSVDPHQGLEALDRDVDLAGHLHEESLGVRPLYVQLQNYCEICNPVSSRAPETDRETVCVARRWLEGRGA